MSSASREKLAVYGYIREYFASIKQDLPPDDIILLLVIWIRFMDMFDQKILHKSIEFHAEIKTKFKRNNIMMNDDSYASVIGTFIVQRGIKQSWTLKTAKTPSIIIGVIDDETCKTADVVTDFTNTIYKGFGLATGSWEMYHDSNASHDSDLKMYVNQFEVAGQPLTITMELDMTQRKCKHGVLRYIVHNKKKERVKEIRTNDKYTNIGYDNIDINKEYRFAISVGRFGLNQWIELVSDADSNCQQ